jgi:hypothetical protein
MSEVLSRPPRPILDDSEVSKRKLLLAELQAVLAESGVRSVVAGNRRLVLRYNDAHLHGPSGKTDPELHVLFRRHNVVTTDGARYRLRDGRQFPVSERAAVAAALVA